MKSMLMGGAILLGLAMCLTSCEGTLDDIFGEWSRPTGNNGNTKTTVAVKSVTLDQTTLTKAVGDDAVTLTATVDPSDASDKTVTWKSSDASIAAVDANGKVTFVAAGSTTITATATNGTEDAADDKTATCEVTVTEVYAANEYKEGSWDGTKVVFTKQTAASVTAMTNTTTTWNAGWYTVSGNVTITGNVTLGAETHLILQDGAKLTITGKLDGYTNNLSIYGQANQTGQLVVNCTDDAISKITTLEVHSCQVKATTSDDNTAGFIAIDVFYVYGGSVDAEYTGSGYGYGILLASSGSMNIYGGDVKAVGKGTGSGDVYGITGSSSTVTVYGGKLWAENAGNKALNVTLTKDAGFTGKIEYSSDKTDWSETADPLAKYVRAGY